MSSTEYAAGYKAGKAEVRSMSPRAAKMYLDMVAPKTDGAHVEFDAGHRAAFVEKAAQ